MLVLKWNPNRFWVSGPALNQHFSAKLRVTTGPIRPNGNKRAQNYPSNFGLNVRA